jgi:ATP-binding cassette subfamily F protein 3
MNAQIVLENIGVRFTNRVLFEQVNWTLYEGMRVSLAGRNGSGKSTLLKILAGAGDSTEGRRTVVGSRNLRVGFLDQTLLDSAVVETLGLKDKSLSAVNFIKARLHDPDDHETSEEEMDWEIRKILSGLGYSKKLMDDPMSHLSGGWLLRMFIAAALLEKPQVLLLDEPTNHLDLSSIQWLEEFLVKEYKGSLVLITHDVALQKRTTDSLAILHGGRFFFKKHQADYLTFRESLGEEKRILEKAIESAKKKIEENLDFAARFKAKAQTAARAQSKMKTAEKLQEECAELENRLLQVEGYNYNLKFRFRLSDLGAKFPISLKNLSFRYNETAPWILKNISLDVKRGQKIAIIGDNGAGKTTMLNVLAERLKPAEGEVLKGYAVETGYFGQHQLDELSLEDSLLDNLRVKAHGVSLEQLRGWLGAFGFPGQDTIMKKTKVLSGGERARLALLRILVTPINVCLLDEPTNHLDIETKELLKTAIREFEGTTIIVSHDREFIADVAERIIYLSSDHQLTDHLGNLESFFAKYPEFVRHIEGKAKPSTLAETDSAPTKPAAAGPTLSYEERKKMKNQMRILERKSEQAEKDIERIGHEKEQMEKQALAGDSQAMTKVGQLETDLHNKMTEWERFSSELEEIRTRYPDLK